MVFTSGIIHYADGPEFFESLPPQALQIFRDAPARWDETQCLIGEPGQMAVFARRSAKVGSSPASMEQTSPAVDLDLSAYNAYHKRIPIVEGTNASMQVMPRLCLRPIGNTQCRRVVDSSCDWTNN